MQREVSCSLTVKYGSTPLPITHQGSVSSYSTQLGYHILSTFPQQHESFTAQSSQLSLICFFTASSQTPLQDVHTVFHLVFATKLGDASLVLSMSTSLGCEHITETIISQNTLTRGKQGERGGEEGRRERKNNCVIDCKNKVTVIFKNLSTQFILSSREKVSSISLVPLLLQFYA